MTTPSVVRFCYSLRHVVAAVVLVAASPTQGGVPDGNAEAWFQQHYAAVWRDQQSLSTAGLRRHFTPQGLMRNADGTVFEWNGVASFEQFVVATLAVGWQRSEVLGIKANALTPSSAALRVHWRSYYQGDTQKDHTQADSCEWYLVDRKDDGWRIAQQAFLGLEQCS